MFRKIAAVALVLAVPVTASATTHHHKTSHAARTATSSTTAATKAKPDAAPANDQPR